MATTDTRTGFRLPWSSDRSHEDATAAEAAAGRRPARRRALEDAARTAACAGRPTRRPARSTRSPDAARVPTPVHCRRPPDRAQEPAMIAFDAVTASGARGAQEALEADGRPGRGHPGDGRGRPRSGAGPGRRGRRAGRRGHPCTDRRRARTPSACARDEDVARIREWSRAEIARIKEETEGRIAARKLGLEERARRPRRRHRAARGPGREHRGRLPRFDACLRRQPGRRGRPVPARHAGRVDARAARARCLGRPQRPVARASSRRPTARRPRHRRRPGTRRRGRDRHGRADRCRPPRRGRARQTSRPTEPPPRPSSSGAPRAVEA